METKICIFKDNHITFLLSKDNNMMVNATEMAKVFGKQVEAFMRNESTILFVQEALKNENSRFLGVKKEEDLIISRQKSGTFMHRILALKFAAWLSPQFEVWVYSTIERLMFGKYVEREKSFERTITLRNEMDRLRDKPNKSGEDFDRYLEIEREMNREKQIRSSLTKESISEMQSLFPENEEE
jgi:hypothetical protein